ncbi:MAG: hypothetical protein JWQ14_1472 [Adhaeribacter sp.]|nr:hypothetical protein [Adhaeribacter sp.]
MLIPYLLIWLSSRIPVRAEYTHQVILMPGNDAVTASSKKYLGFNIYFLLPLNSSRLNGAAVIF